MAGDLIVDARTGGRVRSGSSAESEGYDVLYDHHLDRALGLAMLLCDSRERAEDAVAEVFIRVLPKWRGGMVNDFWPYLRTAVVNQIRGHARRAVVADRFWRSTRADEAIAPGDDSIVERTRLATALEGLPHRQRHAVVLRYLEDLSEAETAELMGCSVGTVKSSASRGVARLREVLTEEAD